MSGFPEEQGRIIYRLRAGIANNAFAYPIYCLELDCCSRRAALLSVTFVAEDLFKNDLGYFIRSTTPWLTKLGFSVIPEIRSYTDAFEYQICSWKNSKDLRLTKREDVFSLMKQIAALLGSPSMRDSSIRIPPVARPLQRLSLELQLLR